MSSRSLAFHLTTLALLSIVLLYSPLSTAVPCDPRAARLMSVNGGMQVLSNAPDRWHQVDPEQDFCPGDKVRTLVQSRATIELSNKSVLSLNQGTTIVFSGVKSQAASWLDLLKGMVYVRSRTPSTMEVRNRYVNAVIRGTEFLVSADDAEGQVIVIEGTVESTNTKGSVTLHSGEAAVAKAGEAPRRKLLITPGDAVQWALHYQPLVDFHALQQQTADPALKQVMLRYEQGDTLGALSALEASPKPAPLLRAAMLLSLGRWQEAKVLLEAVPVGDDRYAEALALQSVVALASNDKAKALALAEQATVRQPQSLAAWSALSYAQQAAFDLDLALQSAQTASKLAPDNALALAREAELLASLGQRSAAREKAETAARLNPRLSKAWTVQAYAQLNAMDYEAAKQSFRLAIDLDHSDPQPRFGFGLAKIRSGELEAGIVDLEIAANLDPKDALMRSYLGKAYYEQKNSKVAATEFGMAKQLDPKDPTPWFYEAIKKQTENREVEAVQDMQQAIALNGNRAIYRSKLMLDDDLAARGSALGRIYNQVGFQRLGQLEAFNSLESNPANYTAHRLLSDSYLNVQRHEMARVSSLLQAQLLQPLNITPLQPQQGESNLLTASGLGPSNPSMNEFNPLFARNQASLLASGIVGGLNTYGNETVLSGIHGQWSGSLGQSHFATSGFRDNNDFDDNIYTAFVQGQVTPSVNVQTEYRHRDVENGFLGLRFDPTPAELMQQNTYRRKESYDIYRFGAHWSPTVSSDLLASFAYQDDHENVGYSPAPVLKVNYDLTRRIYSGEMQYLYRHEWVDAVLGGGHVETNGHGISTATFAGMPFSIPSNQDRTQTIGYAYFHPHFPDHLTWTLGLSGESLTFGALGFDATKINPKLGVTWQITPSTSVRAAYFRTLRHTQIGEQTLEPVQVAGFNQFFDDLAATTATRYGLALDHRISSDWSAGAEISQRDLDVPTVLQGAINLTSSYFWREQLYRGYVYWTPTERISARVDYSYEDFFNSDYAPNSGAAPSTRTHTLPMALSYFDPTGWFATLKATYVNQQVNTDGNRYQSEDFTLVDTTLGYRLPRRIGIIQFDIRNLFDQSFRYQSYGLRTQAFEQAPFIPNRAVYGRVTLSF